MRFRDATQTIDLDSNSKGLAVIAAGQWRCATSSLQYAFEQALEPALAPSMHGAYLMPDVQKLRQAVLLQDTKSKSARQKMLHELLRGYNASTDWPGFAFLDDILDLYPDCKVILNKRSSAKAWEESVRSSLRFYSTWQYHALTYWIPQSYWHWKLYRGWMRLARARYGVNDAFSQKCYTRHLEWAREVAAARGKDVLEWEPSEGWEPLCQFLDVEVPEEPFPRMNESRELEMLTVSLIRRGFVAWAVVLSVLVAAWFVLYWLLRRL